MNSTLKGRKSLANCQRIASFESQEHGPMTADNVVFAFQMPLPKKGMHLEFSRWQQNLIGVLSLDIEYEKEVIENQRKNGILFSPSFLLDVTFQISHQFRWNVKHGLSY